MGGPTSEVHDSARLASRPAKTSPRASALCRIQRKSSNKRTIKGRILHFLSTKSLHVKDGKRPIGVHTLIDIGIGIFQLSAATDQELGNHAVFGNFYGLTMGAQRRLQIG